ncbi:MAG: DUF2252 family protein [Bdellovibrionia bacterium]
MNQDYRFAHKLIAFVALILITPLSAQGGEEDPLKSLQKDICHLISKAKSKQLSKREIASFSADPLRRKLQELNPWLTPGQIEAKIESCGSSFKFMRSFVSTYYDLIANGIPGHAKRFAALRSHQGWIVGDAHPENFGALLNDRGKSTFTMNDLDDFSQGPLYLDFLRFISAVKLRDDTISIKKLLKAYQKGLGGEDRDFSEATEKLLKKSEKKGLTVDPDLPDDAVALTAAEKARMKKWVQDTLGDEFSFKDAYQRDREEGGSGGLQRLELLLASKAKAHISSDLVPVELKELTTPSTFPIQSGPIPSAEKRIEEGLDITLGRNASHVYRVVEWDGKKMLMRPRWDGNLSTKLKRFDDDEVEDVIKDEAYELGALHRKSATDREAYLKAFSEFSVSDWDEESDRVAKSIHKIFNDLQ